MEYSNNGGPDAEPLPEQLPDPLMLALIDQLATARVALLGLGDLLSLPIPALLLEHSMNRQGIVANRRSTIGLGVFQECSRSLQSAELTLPCEEPTISASLRLHYSSNDPGMILEYSNIGGRDAEGNTQSQAM